MNIEDLKGRILSVEQVAAFLCYSIKHVQKMCRQKVLAAQKVGPRGRRWLISGDSLYELLKARSSMPPEERELDLLDHADPLPQATPTDELPGGAA